MTEHTPGPWRITGEHSDLGIWAEGHGYIVVSIPCSGPNPQRNQQQKANAELIARAPDMATEIERLRAENAALLEALQFAHDHLAAAGHECAWADEITPELAMVRATITRAKGET